MKRVKTLGICLILLFSISQIAHAQRKAMNFGIYETVPLDDLRPFSENLSKFIINQELDLDSPVLGYVSISNAAYFDSLFTEASTPKMNLMLTRPHPGASGNSYAIISLKEKPFIDISDISKTIARGNSVEIRFTYKGAQKWAQMTKANVGNIVAFSINKEIWSLPMINAEIKSGAAMISGIENEITAKELSSMLNAAITK